MKLHIFPISNVIEKNRKLFSNLNDLSLMTISGQRVPLNVNTCKMTLYWLVINPRKSFCTGKQYNIINNFHFTIIIVFLRFI